MVVNILKPYLNNYSTVADWFLYEAYPIKPEYEKNIKEIQIRITMSSKIMKLSQVI